MSKAPKNKFYSLDKILEYNADYNIIYGERSNGKTTAVLAYALKRYIESGYTEQLGIVRRMEEDFRGKNGQQMFDGINSLGWVSEWTDDTFNSVWYYSQRWYLVKYDDNGKVETKMTEPFAYGFAIGSEEHYKSTSYPDIKTVLFDEFLTRRYYLPNEFVSFQNLLSTIIRLRDDVKIFMCGNTINKYCPYKNEMGLWNMSKQAQGTIDVYTYGDSGLVVACEYAEGMDKKKKKSNKYFAFDNPKLKMITSGSWEIDIYPHLPTKYKPKDILYHFYIKFDIELLEAEIITVEEKTFIYIHRKTTPIKGDNKQLVYQQTVDYRRNYRTNILKPYGKADKKIYELVKQGRLFYQDNDVGEIVNNYLKWCRQQI